MPKLDRLTWALIAILIAFGLYFVYAYESAQGMLPK